MIKKNNIKKIIDALKADGIPKFEFARLIGVSRMAIYRYEKNITKPRVPIAKKILQVSKHINHGLKLEDIA